MKKLKLKVVMFKEKDEFIIYSPTLDLSSCGKTKSEAQKNFTEAVNLFFEEMERMGTLDEVLLELGWHKVPAKTLKKTTYIPPHLLNLNITLPKGISI